MLCNFSLKAPSLGHLIGTLLGAPKNRGFSVFHDKIYCIFNVISYFFKNFEKKRTLYLKKNFNFIIVFSRTTGKQAVPPSPVKLLPRNRHRSREVVGPASPAGCRSPPSEAVLRHPAKKFPNTWAVLSFACSHCLFRPKRASVREQNRFIME